VGQAQALQKHSEPQSDDDSSQKTQSTGWRQRLDFVLSPNIRGKIVLPYLILTFVVAAIGVYIVGWLVARSLDERLNNQLLEAGRVVSDQFAVQEIEHIESARAVALTAGLAEALQAGDRDRVATLAQPAAAVKAIESLIIVDAQGQTALRALMQADGRFEIAQESIAPLWMVQELLDSGDLDARPKRGLVRYDQDGRYYYSTALPIGLEEELVGVIVVGTSLDVLLPYLKQTSFSDVTIYTDGGIAAATTQLLAGGTSLEQLSISPALYQAVLDGENFTVMENAQFQETVEIRERSYRLAYGPLRIADDTLGAFSVALPSNFVVERGVTSSITYVLIFAGMAAGVVVIGYLISQRITSPISRLVRTSQAVAEGDLEQRTGIVSADEIGFLASTFDDMTGKLADRTRTLEETLGRLRAILSSIGDGVVLADQQGNLIPLNATAETLLKEMDSNHLLEPLHELSAEEREETALAKSPWLLERRRFDVGKKVVSAHSAAVRTDSGEFLGTVIVLRDVTAEVEADRLKDAFVAHVSHELRTPLTAIKGYSELLIGHAGGSLAPEQLGFLHTINRHTESLVGMINALLDFSEMEAWGKLHIEFLTVRPPSLIEEIAREWRPKMEEKNLAFHIETADDLPTISADGKRLRWVIVNLVNNAWQYTPEGGSVTLRTFVQDGHITFEVTDTGIGISPEDQEQLFTRFYRVKQATFGDTRGIGLGLYVAKAIVDAHQGEILVQSEVDVGSTFSVILPVHQVEGTV
jgi:PAS domain S-box-containing protein